MPGGELIELEVGDPFVHGSLDYSVSSFDKAELKLEDPVIDSRISFWASCSCGRSLTANGYRCRVGRLEKVGRACEHGW